MRDKITAALVLKSVMQALSQSIQKQLPKMANVGKLGPFTSTVTNRGPLEECTYSFNPSMLPVTIYCTHQVVRIADANHSTIEIPLEQISRMRLIVKRLCEELKRRHNTGTGPQHSPMGNKLVNKRPNPVDWSKLLKGTDVTLDY